MNKNNSNDKTIRSTERLFSTPFFPVSDGLHSELLGRYFCITGDEIGYADDTWSGLQERTVDAICSVHAWSRNKLYLHGKLRKRLNWEYETSAATIPWTADAVELSQKWLSLARQLLQNGNPPVFRALGTLLAHECGHWLLAFTLSAETRTYILDDEHAFFYRVEQILDVLYDGALQAIDEGVRNA